jgi:carbon monoxide dehydrogenase subunit G
MPRTIAWEKTNGDEQGDGGIAGFTKGGVTVELADQDGGTRLTNNVEAQIGGKSLRSLGSASSMVPRRSVLTISSFVSPKP